MSSLLILSILPLLTSATQSSTADLRLNHIQIIGTHNSYHREISARERPLFEQIVPNFQNYYYSHPSLHTQLTQQHVRAVEFDLHPDEHGGLYSTPLTWDLSNLTEAERPFNTSTLEKPGTKVFHLTDIDMNSNCHSFVDCLTELRGWSDQQNRTHLPILVDLEFKSDAPTCLLGGVCADEAKHWTLARLLNVDREIRSIFGPERLVVPDDVRRDNCTLEESVLRYGWPRLDDIRGRFMFYMDNDPRSDRKWDPRRVYTFAGHASLENRTMFTNAPEGSPDAAVMKHNDPRGMENIGEIQRLVRKGYIVRTRADIPLDTVLTRDTARREAAFESGAQIVTTDFPVHGPSARWGWDYAVQLGAGRAAVCNPVTAPQVCVDSLVQ